MKSVIELDTERVDLERRARELHAEAAGLEFRARDLRRQAALQLRQAKVGPLIERVRKCAGVGVFYGPLSGQDLLDLIAIVEER